MNNKPQGPDFHRRIYLLAQPKTISDLLVRMLILENQPHLHWNASGLSTFTRNLEPLIGLEHQPLEEWRADEKDQIRDIFQQSFSARDCFLRDGEAQGKIVFAKDHCNLMWNPAAGDPYFTVGPPGEVVQGGATVKNPTVLSDSYLGSWLPIFLITHPARVFPSFCRGLLDLQAQTNNCQEERKIGNYFRAQMTFSHTRRLYDWYVDYFRKKEDSARPIVVDSSDLINDPRVIFAITKELGLDQSKVQFSWDPKEEETTDVMKRVFLRTIKTSHGVQKDKAVVNQDLHDQEQKWKEEFAKELANLISSCVRAAMPDYEYLRGKRLCAF
ncbi:hypothetical protein BDW42DRAFT_190354 [Aspergillus taichungensis]|uniref:P-loop containing nucleoside triphosphate hydrolase protein n=1 Tax=Aspergillus taichungensis TaxID=482145 RepID=A0A2J5I8E0_9EURO|nr:hypothetical protein BDW42DRAFT_190354 [Aspergillus taichungensis]